MSNHIPKDVVRPRADPVPGIYEYSVLEPNAPPKEE